MNNCKFLLTVFLLLFFGSASAQDSLRLTVLEADQLFLRSNLMLVAERLNVASQKAMEIQARLYPNPEFSIGVNAFDAENRKAFYAGPKGDKSFEFHQLILLGGKRRSQIGLAHENTQQAEIQLESLLRNLRYELHTALYSVHFDLRTLNKFNIQLAQLDTIIAAYEKQAASGNIPLKEVVRLKSSFIRLNNDKTEVLESIQESQKKLRILLNTRQFVFPVIDTGQVRYLEQLPTIDSLQSLALHYREDLRAAESAGKLAKLNYRLQKSLAIPDLTLGTAYEQLGGAFNHQFMLTAGIPLPLWNRNQGNIRSAEWQRQAADSQLVYRRKIVEEEVKEAWANMYRSIQEYQEVRQVYNSDFADVYAGMQSNFLKRNITLGEFVDFFESYSSTVAEVYTIRKKLMISAENINYVVAYPVYSIH